MKTYSDKGIGQYFPNTLYIACIGCVPDDVVWRRLAVSLDDGLDGGVHLRPTDDLGIRETEQNFKMSNISYLSHPFPQSLTHSTTVAVTGIL